jgi:hypothetical protein
MDPEKLKAAIDAIKNNDGDAALALLEEILAGAPSAEGSPDALAGTPAAPTEEQQAAAAALTSLSAAFGAKNPGELVTRVTALKAEVDALFANRAALELSERRGLIADLVQLGAETPATAWTGQPADRNPCKRLSAEPIEDMRERVTALKASRPAPAGARPPVKDAPAAGELRKLSRAEEEYCRKNNLTREQFEARKAESVRSN